MALPFSNSVSSSSPLMPPSIVPKPKKEKSKEAIFGKKNLSPPDGASKDKIRKRTHSSGSDDSMGSEYDPMAMFMKLELQKYIALYSNI